MANTLRDWLGPLLDDEVEKALDWKRAQETRKGESKVKLEFGIRANEQPSEDKYLDNGSNLRATIARPRSETSRLQIVQVCTRMSLL